MSASIILNFGAWLLVVAVIAIANFVYRNNDSEHRLIAIADLTFAIILAISFGVLLCAFSNSPSTPTLVKNFYFLVTANFYAAVFSVFSRIYKA